MVEDEFDYLFKCIAVGDGGCGKTALVVRFSQGFFQENYKMTIGVEFAVKSIEVSNQKGHSYNVKIQIWDTGGQDRFQYVRPLYYRGAMGTILLFDLTNRESFDHIPRWIDEVRSNTGDIPMLMVGNKRDLVHERVVTREEAEALAEKLDLFYIESSAKDGSGVSDVFSILALLMIGDDIPTNIFSKNKKVLKVQAAHDNSLPQPKPLPYKPNLTNLQPQPLPVKLNLPEIEPEPLPVKLNIPITKSPSAESNLKSVSPRPIAQPKQERKTSSIKITTHASEVDAKPIKEELQPGPTSPEEKEPKWYAPTPPKKKPVSQKLGNSNQPTSLKIDQLASVTSQINRNAIPASEKKGEDEYFAPAPPPKQQSVSKKIVIKPRSEISTSKIADNPFFSKKTSQGKQNSSSASQNQPIPVKQGFENNRVEKEVPLNESARMSQPQITPVKTALPDIRVDAEKKSDLTKNPFFSSSLKKVSDLPVSEPEGQKPPQTETSTVVSEVKPIPSSEPSKPAGKYDSFLTALKKRESPAPVVKSEKLTSLFQSHPGSEKKQVPSSQPVSKVAQMISAQPKVITPGTPAKVKSEKFKFCGKCGAQLNKSFKFCNKCGSKID